PGQESATRIEYPYRIAIGNAACARIGGSDLDRFAPTDLGRLAQAGRIKLAVQADSRLIGQQVKRVALDLVAAQPFVRLAPDRMARAFLIAISGNGLGEYFYFPRRGV